MKSQVIKAIFTNLLFVIGIILTITGFVRGTSTAVKIAVFDKYPLNNYEETRCELDPVSREVPLAKPIEETLTEEEKLERQESCIKSLEYSRRIKKVEDITYSISFLVSGLALAVIFKRFIFSPPKDS